LNFRQLAFSNVLWTQRYFEVTQWDLPVSPEVLTELTYPQSST